jgi:hypothetical protein
MNFVHVWADASYYARPCMKAAAVAMGLAAAALAACTPSPRDDLAGRWETHLSVDDACGFELPNLPANFVMPMGSSCGNEGMWRLEFTPIADRRGTDQRWYEFDVWRSGVRDVYGKLAVTATGLTIADEGGRSSCIHPESGHYEWELRHSELRLTLLGDRCTGWRAVLAPRPWAKVN